jgi:hypothetical protein
MYRVFGNVDRRSNGTVKSEYPAWYWDILQEELDNEVREKENVLKRGGVPSEAMPRFRGELEKKQIRLEQIKEETPKLTGPEKDELSKMLKEMVERIKDSNYKRSEMDKGWADSHEEARRMSEYCISIQSGNEKTWVEQCQVKLVDGKVTRTDFERMYKIGAKLLGDPDKFPIDIERLRKP